MVLPVAPPQGALQRGALALCRAPVARRLAISHDFLGAHQVDLSFRDTSPVRLLTYTASSKVLSRTAQCPGYACSVPSPLNKQRTVVLGLNAEFVTSIVTNELVAHGAQRARKACLRELRVATINGDRSRPKSNRGERFEQRNGVRAGWTAKTQPFETSQQAWVFVQATLDNLREVKTVLDQRLPGFALYSMIRRSIEAASLALWTLDPPAEDLATRCALRIVHQNIDYGRVLQTTMNQGLAGPHGFVAGEAADWHRRLKGISYACFERAIKTTDAISVVDTVHPAHQSELTLFDRLEVWRLRSAVTHAYRTALVQLWERHPDGGLGESATRTPRVMTGNDSLDTLRTDAAIRDHRNHPGTQETRICHEAVSPARPTARADMDSRDDVYALPSGVGTNACAYQWSKNVLIAGYWNNGASGPVDHRPLPERVVKSDHRRRHGRVAFSTNRGVEIDREGHLLACLRNINRRTLSARRVYDLELPRYRRAGGRNHGPMLR